MSEALSATRRLSLLDALGETANQQNAMLLVQLRWLAVFGQAFTIVVGTVLFDLLLPMAPMFGIVGLLVLLNLVSMLRPRMGGEVRNGELMAGLVFDMTALTALLYLSGGAGNPFVFLYALQVTLAAVLLETWSTWVLAALACLCFAMLMRFHVPLVVRGGDGSGDHLFHLHVLGMFVCFLLDVVLLVLFTGRISANLRRRDQRLADLRQQAAEHDHIVRMGLLASGAAHELGTPMATMSVILGDWKRMAAFRDDPDLRQELDDMDVALQRCKRIVGGILMSAGEARGEAPALTTLAESLATLVERWGNVAPGVPLEVTIEEPLDEVAFRRTPVVSDTSLRQMVFNVLDNAREVSPGWVGLSVRCHGGEIVVTVRDRGPGFSPAMLDNFGKPYQSSKDRPGSGLGLFLVVNVLRKLGGSVQAANGDNGGAVVTLRLPLAALTVET
ncbi:MAG: histidine kinase [Xanthomonadaceae bacterium]|nr:histidine kinase [Xanthomonadaceae bacterium]